MTLMRANVSLLNEIRREGDLDQTTPQLAGGAGEGQAEFPSLIVFFEILRETADRKSMAAAKPGPLLVRAPREEEGAFSLSIKVFEAKPKQSEENTPQLHYLLA